MDQVPEIIAQLQKEMESFELKLKVMINQLCELDGRPPIYEDVGPHHFEGQPLASSVRTILEARRAGPGDGPDSAREIYDALVTGGYRFAAKDAKSAMRGLQLSLSRNTLFYKDDNGKFGLADWLPKVAARPKKRGKGG